MCQYLKRLVSVLSTQQLVLTGEDECELINGTAEGKNTTELFQLGWGEANYKLFNGTQEMKYITV